MDKTFVNVIYIDKLSNRFAFLFIFMFLFIPNVALIVGLALMFREEVLNNSTILLSVGLYTIFNVFFIIISYFLLENNKEKSIRVMDEGLVYNSITKRFAIPWASVHRVQVNPYVSNRPFVMVHTEKGRFYFSGMYVDTSDELPAIKPGFLRPKFYYPSGGTFDSDLYKSALFQVFKEKVPDKFY